MPRATAAAAAITAQHVLDSAVDLFGRRGFADVSLDDIAQASGVTRGAVYHHYRSKSGMFTAVVASLQAKVAEVVVERAEAAGAEPEAQLRAGSHGFIDAITDPAFVRILLIDAPSVIGWQQWRTLDEQSSVVQLHDALERTKVDRSLLEATTAQLSGAMNEAALWVAQHEHTDDARTQAHAVLDKLLDALLPEIAPRPSEAQAGEPGS